MDIEFCGRLAIDGLIESLEDLGCQSRTSNGADRLAGVVRKTKLVLVGESSKLVENIWGEEIGGVDGGVVNGCHIDNVKDCCCSVRYK